MGGEEDTAGVNPDATEGEEESHSHWALLITTRILMHHANPEGGGG